MIFEKYVQVFNHVPVGVESAMACVLEEDGDRDLRIFFS